MGDNNLPERVARVETKQNNIEGNVTELLKVSKAQHDSIRSLSEGFNSLSHAINQLSDLEKSNSKNHGLILDLQKQINTNSNKFLEFKQEEFTPVKSSVDKFDKLLDRIVTGSIVVVLFALYSVLPFKQFLTLLLGILI